MSKQLSPLETFKKIEVDIYSNDIDYTTIHNELDIIETALKDCETYKNILKEEYDKNIELKEIATQWRDCSQKQAEILRIIKEKEIDVHTLILAPTVESYNCCELVEEYKLTQEEYDLLKEHLY